MRVVARDFFDRVSRSHPDDGVGIEEALEEVREDRGGIRDLGGNFVGIADGAAVAAFESVGNASFQNDLSGSLARDFEARFTQRPQCAQMRNTRNLGHA